MDGSNDNSAGNRPRGFFAGYKSSFDGTGRAVGRVSRYLQRWWNSTATEALKSYGPPNPTQTPQNYLLLCINMQRNRSCLKQIPVGENTKDMWLFQEISREYFGARGWRSRFTLHTVQRIRFVKVWHFTAHLEIL